MSDIPALYTKPIPEQFARKIFEYLEEAISRDKQLPLLERKLTALRCLLEDEGYIPAHPDEKELSVSWTELKPGDRVISATECEFHVPHEIISIRDGNYPDWCSVEMRTSTATSSAHYKKSAIWVVRRVARKPLNILVTETAPGCSDELLMAFHKSLLDDRNPRMIRNKDTNTYDFVEDPKKDPTDT